MTPAHETYDDLETMYWDELVNDKSDPPIYGADVCQSITDPVTKLFYLMMTNIPTHDSPTEGRSVRKKKLTFSSNKNVCTYNYYFGKLKIILNHRFSRQILPTKHPSLRSDTNTHENYVTTFISYISCRYIFSLPLVFQLKRITMKIIIFGISQKWLVIIAP